MLEVFIAFILIIFFGLFLVLSFPMKDEIAKLNKQKQSQQNTQHSKLQDS